jgi:hypothetical protein
MLISPTGCSSRPSLARVVQLGMRCAGLFGVVVTCQSSSRPVPRDLNRIPPASARGVRERLTGAAMAANPTWTSSEMAMQFASRTRWTRVVEPAETRAARSGGGTPSAAGPGFRPQAAAERHHYMGGCAGRCGGCRGRVCHSVGLQQRLHSGDLLFRISATRLGGIRSSSSSRRTGSIQRQFEGSGCRGRSLSKRIRV